MSNLTGIERIKLERLFEMDSGYVLNFSDRSFRDFILATLAIDIYGEKYVYKGTSKAKRLRAFWEQESDVLVGKLTFEMLEYWKTIKLVDSHSIKSSEQELFDSCLTIAKRLLGKKNQNTPLTENQFMNQEFKNISLDKLKLDSLIINVLKQRLEEIKKCLEVNASLAVIFLCGSVLEGVLLGIGTSKPKEFNQSACSPKRDEKVLPFPEWTLSNFIDVAHSLNLLGEDVKKFSHALRDFRNYIHPYQQMQSRFAPDTHTAKICWQVLQAALYQLSNQN